ncbi:hypothetical protein FOA52_010464 [Chlamydomonas sp. UWO 241]|nr:hypothetical protein FOA52_010464 [Chlamydomonas sp. UWO 241]
MAASAPTRDTTCADTVRHNIREFLKLAHAAPSVEGEGEAEALFIKVIPIALAKAAMSVEAYASGDAANRFVVRELTQSGLFTALGSVVDRLNDPPEKRLSLTRSTLRALPGTLANYVLQSVQEATGNEGWISGLFLYATILKKFLVLGAPTGLVPVHVSEYCMATKADALAESGLFPAFVRLITKIEGPGRDTALGDGCIQTACGIAAQLGCSAFGREGISVEPMQGDPGGAHYSPVTSDRLGQCQVGMEAGNIGPVISGVPPSSVLKALIDGGEVGDFLVRRMLRLCADMGSTLHETMGADLGHDKRRSRLEPIDFALVGEGDEFEDNRAFFTLQELIFHVRVIPLLGAARLPEGVYDPKETLEQLLELGLATCMEAGIRRAEAKPPGKSTMAQYQVHDIRGCVLVLTKCSGCRELASGSPAMLSLAVTLRKLFSMIATQGTWLNSRVGPHDDHQNATEWAAPFSVGCSCGSCDVCFALRAERLTPAGLIVGALLNSSLELANTMTFEEDVSPAAESLRSQVTAGLARTLLPPMVAAMDTCCESLALFGGQNPSEGCYNDACKLLWASPQTWTATSELVGHWLTEPLAGVPTEAGADYALLQLPSGLTLSKAADCSNPRCLNAAGDSELGLKTMKCGACGLRYCGRACQAAAFSVHKRVCGGKAAEWMAEASRS